MSKPFHVYMDLDVFNNTTGSTASAPQLSFEETRTQPFLDGTTEDYFVAIARFSIQTGGTLPVFIPVIDTTQSDPNRTVYQISVSYQQWGATTPIVYVPQTDQVSNGVAAPNGPNGQDLRGDYYHIRNYQDWIAMVNTALKTAHVALINKVRSESTTDLFVGRAATYTETITLPSAKAVLYFTTTPPFSVGETTITATNNITIIVSIGTTTLSGGVQQYGVAIVMKNAADALVSTATYTSSTPINTNTSQPLVLVDRSTNNNSSFTISTAINTDGIAPALTPFMQIDLSTLTCVLNVDARWYDSSIAIGTASIYFNTRLYELFTGFPAQFKLYSGLNNYQILTSNLNYSNTLSVNNNGTSQKYIQAFQEVSTVGLWNPVSSIVFTSTTLPIHPTLTSPPKIYNSNSNGMQGGGTTNLSNTLTDFEIAITNTNQYRPEISYAPLGEYRLIDMYSNSNLCKIDLNVYWKDKWGNLKPLRLLPGCSASVKLLFRHKGFYLGAD